MATLLLHVVLDRQRNHPFATLSIIDVFPLRPDSFLKEHVVGVRHDLLHLIYVVVHAPEVLDGVKTVNLVKDVFMMSTLLPLLLLFVVT